MAARDDATAAPTAAPRPPLAYRLTGRQWLGIDVAAAVIATGIALFDVGLVHHGFRYHVPTAVAATAAVAGIAPVAVRRIWPLPVLAVVTAACCVLTAYGHMRNLVYVALGMAIYTVASHCRRPVAVAAAVIVEVALGAAVLAAFVLGHHTQLDPARGPLVAGALWFIGDSVRERRRYLAGVAEQEAQRRSAEAERGRQAVREERVRIARELHDVVAHSLSVVTVQAGVGRKVGSVSPAEALRALRAVEVTGRGALEELRRILGLLRDDDADRVSLAPAPGLGDLDELADSVRAAGTPVGLAVTADPAALPPAAALTVYRIVQEALTNVVKHARGAEAWVRVRADEGGVRVTVTDNGDGSGADPGGSGRGPADRHGIVGMRERAAAFGGTLDAGPRPEGGFRVTAFLPARASAVPDPAGTEPDAAVGQPGMTIGVVVADDQAIVRAGFRLLIDSEPDLTVLGEAANGAEAVEVARKTTPDVVLMDIRMPVLDGIEATRRITAAGAASRVLILTTFDLDEYVFGALRAGASGFMLKERPPEELLSAIRVIAAGEALLAPNVTHRLIAHFARQPDPMRPPPKALAQLTAREREVLVLIANGLSNTEIAGRLVMSVPTAKTHVSRILTKLAARDRAQLVVFAYQAGLVTAG